MRFRVPPSATSEQVRDTNNEYVKYLESNWDRLPHGVKQFVLEPWYHFPTYSRAPQYSALLSLTSHDSTLTLKLFNERYDSTIEFRYLNVAEFHCNILPDQFTFYYDEVLLEKSGMITHEIRSLDDQEIIIKCHDVTYESDGLDSSPSPDPS